MNTEVETAQTVNTVKALRPDLLKLKPRYKKRGRPTKEEWIEAGKPMTREQWRLLWMREGPGWGGKRPGTGSLPKGKKTVRMDFTIDVEIAAQLERMPLGKRSRFVNKALELLLMMQPAPKEKAPLFPPRGRHAHKEKGWKQQRVSRMTKIELAKFRLEQAQERIAEARALGLLL